MGEDEWDAELLLKNDREAVLKFAEAVKRGAQVVAGPQTAKKANGLTVVVPVEGIDEGTLYALDLAKLFTGNRATFKLEVPVTCPVCGADDCQDSKVGAVQ